MNESLMQGILAPLDYQVVETDSDIKLGEPKVPQPYTKQQLGVYLRIGTHLGDVMSDDRYFTYTELRDKVRAIVSAWLLTTQKPVLMKEVILAEEDDERDINLKTSTRRK